MTLSEFILRILSGEKLFNYILLPEAIDYQPYPAQGNLISAFFSFQKNSKLKNYVPSKSDIEKSLQDNVAGDKQSMVEDIAYLEILKMSKRRNAQKQSGLKSNVSVFIIIFITIITLFITTNAIIFQLKNQVNEELFDQFYTPLQTNVVIPVVSDFKDPILDEAFMKYSNKDYSHALELFNSIKPSSHLYYTAQFFTGICDIELNQADAALLHFDKITATFSFDMHLNWYKGLCYIKRGSLKEAFLIFTEIKKSNNSYNRKAEEILKKLNQ
jgi:tetratricopeptide (TPR) repeat protein